MAIDLGLEYLHKNHERPLWIVSANHVDVEEGNGYWRVEFSTAVESIIVHVDVNNQSVVLHSRIALKNDVSN